MDAAFPHEGERHCPDTEATWELGAEIGRAVRTGDVIILDGPLGAGKTTLTQGIARGMQVRGRVTSPTFTIAREHRSTVDGPTLIHVDAYRLLGQTGAGEKGERVDPHGALDSLDLDTDLEHAVVVAEWGAGLVDALADTYLLVKLVRPEGGDVDSDGNEERIISWSTVGNFNDA